MMGVYFLFCTLLIESSASKADDLQASGQLWYSSTEHAGYLEHALVDLQHALSVKATEYNTSFSIGVFDGTVGAFEVTAGINDKQTGEQMKVHKEFPVGSVTKPYTASAIMQLHEQKRIDIDAPIYHYVDPILTRLNKTTMLKLWNGDTTCQTITARMLMGMRGGLHDYNDTWYQEVTINDPTFDVSPFDLLHRLNKSWVCPPGECGEYASTGFELLGLALAQITGAEQWQDYDQFSVFPKSVKANYNHTEFPGRGLCSDHPNIVHQYNAWYGNGTKWMPSKDDTIIKVNITDLYKDSCLNGWTCGNIAASPGDIARFHWDLHHGNIVSQASLKEMLHWVPMKVGWEPQLYGLAMMQTWPYQGHAWEPDPHNVSYTVGHAGADYGSLGMMSGFNTKYKFGISFVSNSASSLNCSLPFNRTTRTGGQNFFIDALCPVYDQVLKIVSNGTAPRLNCSSCPECPVLKPKSKDCLPGVKKICGSVQHNKTECTKCYNANAHNFTKIGCSYCDELSFCNITISGHGHGASCNGAAPSPSPPIACDWQI